jgi:hypothetical protein
VRGVFERRGGEVVGVEVVVVEEAHDLNVRQGCRAFFSISIAQVGAGIMQVG